MSMGYELFLQVVNMSITASVAILVVILLRSLLKKAPKIFSYLLWGVVLFRLLFPVAIPADISLFHLLEIPVAGRESQEALDDKPGNIDDGRVEMEEVNSKARQASGEPGSSLIIQPQSLVQDGQAGAIDAQSEDRDGFVRTGELDAQSKEQVAAFQVGELETQTREQTTSSQSGESDTQSREWIGSAQIGELDTQTKAQAVSVRVLKIPARVLGLEMSVMLPAIWLLGAGSLLFCGILRLILLKNQMSAKIRLEDNIYLVDHIESPFVLGLLFPKIYLPSDLKEGEYNYVIVHEKHHIRRGDHLTRLLTYVALCLHWFNPLVWLAFLLSERDMEMSCDEAVIQKLGREIRAEYSASLLRLAAGHKAILGTPLAFGEGETGGRVKNVMQYKKPKPGILLLSILICITAGGCLMTDSEDRLADGGDFQRIDLQSEWEDGEEGSEESQQESTKEAMNLEEEAEGNRNVQIDEQDKQANQQSEEVNSLTDSEKETEPSEDVEAKLISEQAAPIAPPNLMLQDSLSSLMNFVEVSPCSYSWSYFTDGKLQTKEGSGYFPTVAVKGKEKEWIKLTDYNGIDFTPYIAGFGVRPDRITVLEYDLLELGNMEPVCLSETVLEEVYFLYLVPRRIYEIRAEWDKENLEDNGYYGEVYYAFATSELTQTVNQGESKARADSSISLEAHVKEIIADRPGSILISSDTDSFPGAFILDVPQKVYDINTIAGGQAFSITMQLTGEMWEDKLPICQAVQMEPIQVQLNSTGESQNQTVLSRIGEVFEEEVNSLEGVKLYMEKYTATGGTLEISNFSDKQLQYGDWFDIQVQTEGSWYSLAYLVENIGFHSIAYGLPQEETREKVVDWESMYGMLPTGTYRIVMDVDDYRAPGDFDKYYIATEFEIMESQ